jgi:signal transduction histidine kinase
LPDLEIFEGLPAPAILLDRTCRAARFNPRAAELFLDRALLGQEVPPLPWLQEAAAALDRSGAPSLTLEKKLDTTLGRRRFQLNLQRASGASGDNWDNGKNGWTVVLLLDLTEQRRAEEGLGELLKNLQRSNQELAQFAYVASHDLQEPLRMVSSYLQLLERRCRDRLDGDGREFLQFALDGAHRMQMLILDLLTYSRVDRKGQPFSPTDLNRMVEQSLSYLGQAIKESGAVIDVGPLPTLAADRIQMLQLFQNLIGNAIKFRSKQPLRIAIEARCSDDVWLFSVKDNGIGIDPQFHERIFKLFQRLHGRSEIPGPGIGLALCQRIVERHGGRIWVESLEGKGADFRCTLKTEPPTVVGPVQPRGSP